MSAGERVADRPLQICVIGSGPAGMYAAEALAGRSDVAVEVDVIDKLPTPFGLARNGVAPDHLKMRQVTRTLQAVLDRPGVRFVGNVDVGTAVTIDELRERYDAVVYAYGAAVERSLGVPGENLAGSLSAADFVNWYCSHPDSPVDTSDLQAREVAVIGAGNVALDVARMLARQPDELLATDVPEDLLGVFRTSRAGDVHVICRRGPAQAKFTPKELRELEKLSDADVLVHGADPAAEATDDLEPAARRNVELFAQWAAQPPRGASRRIHFWFFRRPVEILGAERVEGITLARTELDADGRARDVPGTEHLDVQLVVRAVGYLGSPLPGVPFDEATGTIPHSDGRVVRDGEVSRGEYVTGWIKRGASGVIGTNKSDATATMQLLVDDLAAAPRRPLASPGLVDLCRARGVAVVEDEGWRNIDAAELALGAQHDRPRVKIWSREDLLRAAAADPAS